MYIGISGGFVIVCLLQTVTEAIFKPRDVSLQTINLYTTVSWTSPVTNDAGQNFTYSVESRVGRRQWEIEKLCDNIPATVCRLTRSNINDIYMGSPIYARIRTITTNGTLSQWVIAPTHRPAEDGIIGPPSIIDISLKNKILTVYLLFPETPYVIEGTSSPMRADNEDLNLGLSANILITGSGIEINEELESQMTGKYIFTNISLQPETIYIINVTSVFMRNFILTQSLTSNTKAFKITDGKIYRGTSIRPNIPAKEDVTTTLTRRSAYIGISEKVTTSTPRRSNYIGISHPTTSYVDKNYLDENTGSGWSKIYTVFTCAVVIILLVSIAVTVKFTHSYEHRRRFRLPQWFSTVVSQYKSASLPRQTRQSETFDELKSTPVPEPGCLIQSDIQPMTICEILPVQDSDEGDQVRYAVQPKNCWDNDNVVQADSDYVQANFLPNFL